MSRASTPTRFPTILADPPWDIQQQGSLGAQRHYRLMSVEQIARLPVGRVTAAAAHLWLWVTNASLFAGRSVMEAWGVGVRPHVSCWVWPDVSGLGELSLFLA